MKREEFYEVLGDIDEAFVSAAHGSMPKKSRPVWLRWGTLTACLCLVISGVFFFFRADNGTHDYAETVIYNNAEYVVCGDGEASILEACGLPAKITEDLAGKHLAYLEQGEKNTCHVSGEAANGDAELFEYAPYPNGNVYILCIDGEYYAAILRDQEGYYGLTDINSPE